MTRNKDNLTGMQRLFIYVTLRKHCDPVTEALPHGIYAALGRKFGVCGATIKRISVRGNENMKEHNIIDVNSLIKTNSGAKRTIVPEEFAAAVDKLSSDSNCTMRSIALATGVAASTVCRLKKEGHIQRRKVKFKPALTEQVMLERCMHAASKRSKENPDMLDPLLNEAHCDEVWSKARAVRYEYCSLDKPRSYQFGNRRHVEQVMFHLHCTSTR
jgi:hypothetical protein